MLTYLVNCARPPRAQGRLRRADQQLQPRRDLHRRGGRTATARTSAGPPGTVYDYRRFGYLTGADTISDTPRVQTATKSTIVGGFVQDSWSIVDKVTLNVGLRYDALTHAGAGRDDPHLARRPAQPAHRRWCGIPTQQGRSKIFANYGRYYEYIPLDIADRALSSSQAAASRRFTTATRWSVGRQGCDAEHPNRRLGADQRRHPGAEPEVGRHRAALPLVRGPGPQVAGQRRDRRRGRVRGPAQRAARRHLHLPQPRPDGGGHVQQRRPDLLHRQPRRGHRRRVPQGHSGRTTRSRCCSPRPSPISGWHRRATPGRS